jgi:hypothetical protein
MSRRLLQLVVVIACLLPLVAGGAGVLRGPAAFGLHEPAFSGPVPRDLDSHFRYISGIFFATGIGFLSCVPRIEATGARFRLLGGLIVVGGLARGLSLVELGAPSTGHLLGLVMETVVVPLLMLWQWRVAQAYRTAPSMPGPASAVGR